MNMVDTFAFLTLLWMFADGCLNCISDLCVGFLKQICLRAVLALPSEGLDWYMTPEVCLSISAHGQVRGLSNGIQEVLPSAAAGTVMASWEKLFNCGVLTEILSDDGVHLTNVVVFFALLLKIRRSEGKRPYVLGTLEILEAIRPSDLKSAKNRVKEAKKD